MHVKADGYYMYWQGELVGVAHLYRREGRSFYQINLAKYGYKRSKRRSTLQALIVALEKEMLA